MEGRFPKSIQIPTLLVKDRGSQVLLSYHALDSLTLMPGVSEHELPRDVMNALGGISG